MRMKAVSGFEFQVSSRGALAASEPPVEILSKVAAAAEPKDLSFHAFELSVAGFR
jgi:hypothetical protein